MSEEKPKATRDGFGEGLVELGRSNKDVVVLSADLTSSVRADWFKKEFPERFYAFGVAEQDMFSSAAGMSLCGKIPFACTFGVFASGRAWDQLRVSVCYMNANVKIGGSHGGITVGPDGATHQAISEIALMRALPGMTMIIPSDALEAKKATIAAAARKGPVYLRLGRSATPLITREKDKFSVGKAAILKKGGDVTLIACGIMVSHALQAAELLGKEGIESAVINMHTLKPIDEEAVHGAAAETGAVVTCEEHSIMGGLGSAVCQALAKKRPVPVEMVGIEDRFGESAEAEELLVRFHLMPEDIAAAAKKALKRKTQ